MEKYKKYDFKHTDLLPLSFAGQLVDKIALVKAEPAHYYRITCKLLRVSE